MREMGKREGLSLHPGVADMSVIIQVRHITVNNRQQSAGLLQTDR